MGRAGNVAIAKVQHPFGREANGHPVLPVVCPSLAGFGARSRVTTDNALASVKRYLCVAIDLFSRCVAGWSARSRLTTDLAMRALPMAVWRQQPTGKVMLHLDQGSQFTSRKRQTFLRQHDLDPSMSRRGPGSPRHFSFGPQPTVIHGHNSAGKSNFPGTTSSAFFSRSSRDFPGRRSAFVRVLQRIQFPQHESQ
ncbi:MAG: hypothetical protein C0524_08135 [Rhodobacter sp.]|nr:hypothetical protein [Rhodobacter sp.]